MPHPDYPVRLRSQDDSAATFVHNQQSFSVPTGKTTDEEGVPNVVFGITDLPVQGAWTEAKRAS